MTQETACLVVRFKARRCESDVAHDGAPHGYTLCCNVTVPVDPRELIPATAGFLAASPLAADLGLGVADATKSGGSSKSQVAGRKSVASHESVASHK